MREKFRIPQAFYNHKKLRELRLRRGISREEVFRGSGITAGTLYQIENAKAMPRFDMLHRLLTFYQADHLEWCEVLKIPCIERQDMVSFRARCREQKIPVDKALDDMIKVFCYEGV